MRRAGLPYLLRKAQVSTAHVMESRGHRRFKRAIRFTTGFDFGHDLERAIKSVEQSTESVQPALAVILRGAREPERSGFDDDLLARAIPPHDGATVRDSDRASLQCTNQAAAEVGSATSSFAATVFGRRSALLGKRSLHSTR